MKYYYVIILLSCVGCTNIFPLHSNKEFLDLKIEQLKCENTRKYLEVSNKRCRETLDEVLLVFKK